MTHQERPLSIIIVSLWSLLRGISDFLIVYGTFILLENALDMFSRPFLEVWAAAPVGRKLFITLVSTQAIVFVILAIGIFWGFNWGRKGFIIASMAVFVWKAYQFLSAAVVQGRMGKLHLPLDSLLALCLALWYFNKENILRYFRTEDKFQSWNWLYYKIGKCPVALVIILALVAIRLLGGLISILINFVLIYK